MVSWSASNPRLSVSDRLIGALPRLTAFYPPREYQNPAFHGVCALTEQLHGGVGHLFPPVRHGRMCVRRGLLLFVVAVRENGAGVRLRAWWVMIVAESLTDTRG